MAAKGILCVAFCASLMADSLITGRSGGTPRNNYTGFTGYRFTPSLNLPVTHLGRWITANSSQPHTVVLLSGTLAEMARVTVNAAAAPIGHFAFVSIPPVTVLAGQPYFLLSSETLGGDMWFDLDQQLTINPLFVITSAYGDTLSTISVTGSLQRGYGPVNIQVGPPSYASVTALSILEWDNPNLWDETSFFSFSITTPEQTLFGSMTSSTNRMALNVMSSLPSGFYHIVGTTTGTNGLVSVPSDTFFVQYHSGVPVTIILQPQDQHLKTGDTLLISISISGGESPVFQWFKNGVAIANATDAIFRIDSVLRSDEGLYHCVVTDLGVSTTSQTAFVKVTGSPKPPINLKAIP
jgi:hypothetical protein